jgi:hypothetical protein
VVKRLTEITQFLDSPAEALAVIERPMINPMRFQASVSAARSLEATLIAIESLGIPRMYVDSRQWQKALLPHWCKGPELKHASADIGCRLFPDRKRSLESTRMRCLAHSRMGPPGGSMNNGIAIGLALICLMLLIVLFKWALNEFKFIQALIAGINQNSDNQWRLSINYNSGLAL